MAWLGGFKGDGYTRDEFRAWLRTQKKPSFLSFLTIHNTGAPYVIPPVSPSQRMRNLGNYYKNEKGWKGGPHWFVIGDKVYPGTPPQFPTVHSPGFNNTSLAIEVEGDYRSGKHDPKSGTGGRAWDTMAWASAEILDWMQWDIDAKHIKMHRDDPRTTHACPGNLVDKQWFINKTLAAATPAQVPSPVPAPVPVPATSKWVANVPTGDWLNTRKGPGTKYETNGKLFNGIKVSVLDTSGAWTQIRTPGGYVVWVSSKYLSDHEPSAASPIEQPTKPTEPAPQPTGDDMVYPAGKANWSEHWLLPMMKKVEGLRLKAYPDKPGWAIGYGHNSTSGVKPLPYEGMTLKNEKEAEDILRIDLNEALRYLNTWTKVPLTQPQVDALIMHIFQQGPTQFRNRVLPAINRGDHAEAAKIIENMDHANPGVERRRRFEAARYRGSKSTTW